MADKRLGGIPASDRKGRVRRAVEYLLPEWQVFIRRPDGRSEHFAFTRRRQTALLAGVAALSLWAGTATMMVVRQPDELADKERHLEALMASYRSAEHRLKSAHQMVSEVTHEVDAVHANLQVLAETSAALARDRSTASHPVTLAKLGSVMADPAYDDDSLPGSGEARSVREDVRKLESSLDQLQQTYGKVVRNTTDVAGQRISEVEGALRHLGLDPNRLVGAEAKGKGQGGPFIPLPETMGGDNGLGGLISRMERWGTVKAALLHVPLAEPVHADWEINSPFGARHDPLNNRTGIHEGVDIGAPYGTPVYATGIGEVKMAGVYDRYGNTVDIDHGDGIMTRYAHLSRIKVHVGQKVTRNTVIGLLGNSGRSTGAHLHYEVRVADIPRNPLNFISAGGDASEAR